MANTIELTGSGVREEKVTTEIVKPGYIMALTSTGEVKLNTSTAVQAGLFVAVPFWSLSHTIETEYAVGDLVQLVTPKKGSNFQIYLKSGDTVVQGDSLKLNSGGTLAKGSGTSDVYAYVLEVCDASASDTLCTCVIA